MLGGVGVCQPVAEETVHEGSVAVFATLAKGGEVMGGIGHGLCTAGYDCRGTAGHYGLAGQDDGFEGGGAYFVDCCADGGIGHAGAEGALSGWVLAKALNSETTSRKG